MLLQAQNYFYMEWAGTVDNAYLHNHNCDTFLTEEVGTGFYPCCCLAVVRLITGFPEEKHSETWDHLLL